TPKPAGESPETLKPDPSISAIPAAGLAEWETAHSAKIEEFVSAAAQLRPTQVSPSHASAPLTAAGLEGGKGLETSAHAEGETREEKVKTKSKITQTTG